MNEFDISELKTGQRASFTAKIEERMMKAFLEITGDINPLHLDSSFAKSKGFSDKVVYGLLTASLISRMGGAIYREEIV